LAMGLPQKLQEIVKYNYLKRNFSLLFIY